MGNTCAANFALAEEEHLPHAGVLASELEPPSPAANQGASALASGAVVTECPDVSPGQQQRSRQSPPTPRSSRAGNKIPFEQNEITLRLGRAGEIQRTADRALHMSVLKELMGEELREIVRDELKLALDPRPPSCHRCESSMEVQDLPDVPTRVSPKVILPVPKAEEIQNENRSQPFSSCSFMVPGRGDFSWQDSDTKGDRPVAQTSSASVPQMALRKHVRRLATENQDVLYNSLQDNSLSQFLTKFSPRVGSLTARVEAALSLIGKQQAPSRVDCISKLADSEIFAVAMNTVIILNCIFMGFAADDEIENNSTGQSDLTFYGDYFFLVAYSFEFAVRLGRYRLYYFYDKNYVKNWLDFTILLSGISSTFVANSVPNVSFLRILLMFRMLKVLRVLRVINMFITLRAIIESLSATFGTFFWSLVMIGMIHYVFALLFVMRVASYFRFREESLDGEEERELKAAFGTTGRAFMSLLYSTNGGNDWCTYFETLQVIGGLDSLLFLFFVAFAQIGLLNIILGIFVDQAIKSLLSSKEEKAKEHATELWKIEEDLRALCAEADADNSGRMSIDEWQHCVGQGNMSSYLDLAGFRVHDVNDFFRMCCNESEDNMVDVDSFVQGCMRLRGTASCFDMQAVLVEVMTLTRAVKNQQHALKKVWAEIEHVLSTKG